MDRDPAFALAEKRLEKFLQSHHYSKDQLLGEVERVFGEPELVVAVGSLMAGLGNVRSDIDLMVIVDKEGLHDIPILSFPKDLMIDAEYYGAGDIANQISTMRDLTWPPEGFVDEALWVRYQRALRSVTRMESGCPLQSTPQWRATLVDLKHPWLRDNVARFWRSEAIRFALSASWVLAEDPLLACIRMGDAVCAALQAKTAMDGELFYHWKWLPEKLRALKDKSSLKIFRKAIRASSSQSDDLALYSELEKDLSSLVDHSEFSGMEYQLRLMRGVKLLPADEGTLVNLWNTDGLLMDKELKALDGNGLLANGLLAEAPSKDIIELFRHGACWLGLAVRKEPVDD
jgi:hypothetical protein